MVNVGMLVVFAAVFMLSTISAAAASTTVTVNAPEVVWPGTTFTATIDIDEVTNLDSGQFDITLDPTGVVDVIGVKDGLIAGTAVSIAMWSWIDGNTIRVLFDLPGTTGVSGSGYVAKIEFSVIGELGDVCTLDISDGILIDTGASVIPASWIDDIVTVGPISTITVNAPEEMVSEPFTATIDIDDVTNLDSGQFDLSFDSSVVDVSGVSDGSIDGTSIPIAMWSYINNDTIRVLFDLPGISGVSGGGELAKIDFSVEGKIGDTSILDISKGLLVNNKAKSIPAVWVDDTVTVGIPCKLGDANGDREVDMRDVTYIELIIMGTKDPTCGADANEDGEIDMRDVTKTELIIMGA